MFRRSALIGFSSFPLALLSSFKMTLFVFDDFDPFLSNNIPYTIVTLIIFIFVVSLLLLNMLIAMMGDTYGDVRDESKKQHDFEVRSNTFVLDL